MCFLNVCVYELQVVTEKLVCYAVVGRQYVRECIITTDVTCQFVSPAVDISSQQINFYVEKVCKNLSLPSRAIIELGVTHY